MILEPNLIQWVECVKSIPASIPEENVMPNQSSSHESGKSGQPSKNGGDKSTKKAADSKSSSSSTRGGTHEQHVKAGEQSHKNDK